MEKNKRQKLINCAVIGVIIAGIVALVLLTKSGKIERVAFGEETNTEASLGSLEDLKEGLAAYPELHKAVFEEAGVEPGENAFIIPGMETTLTLHHDHEEADICTTMTPQGLAVNADYLFLSAYCQTKEHNSVVYVLDKKSGSFIKEIVLDGIPHAGGLAYDNNHDLLWVTSEKGDTAQVITLALADIEAYDFMAASEPIRYADSIDLPDIKRASTITVHGNDLYAAYFNDNGASVMHRYAISTKENADGKEVRTLDTGKSTEEAYPDDVDKIGREIQGLAFHQEKLMLSRSAGREDDSTLLSFDRLQETENFTDKNASTEIALPAYLEQIAVDGKQLYILFESGAYPYRDHGNPSIDRVLRVEIDTLFSE
ncbi:YncE family protein [Trichococcus ilyis]|jgi:hypothetical protein|uniref:Phytase-like domain-containing protein n=1 Tax=Trichococcus ilyis TaxID=640938 RepID=A0A143YN75_9LACT|nr:hypothetical protein [Trichococcus ilyis]CZQ93149.1 Hypothetical protein TR210_1115 [Trichococcus ilyis]SEI92121.1 hypothetical protein SAMN05216375_10535 [Trichococcus ilyis]